MLRRCADPARVRVPVCWGDYEGRYVCDIGMGEVFSLLMSMCARHVLFENAICAAASPPSAPDRAFDSDCCRLTGDPLDLDAIGLLHRLGKVTGGLHPEPGIRPSANALSRRIAISGEMPERAFTSSESCLRLTPGFLAASVTLNPDGSRQSWARTGQDEAGSSSLFTSPVSVLPYRVFSPELT